jgi:hypothetical protein
MLTCSRCCVAALCLSGADLEFFTYTNTAGTKEVVVRWKCHPEYGPYGTLSKYGGHAPWDCPRKPLRGVQRRKK